MSDEGDACFYNAKAPVVNIKSSSLLWGRILFASGSPENLAANQFSEKICVLNLGFFLEVKCKLKYFWAGIIDEKHVGLRNKEIKTATTQLVIFDRKFKS